MKFYYLAPFKMAAVKRAWFWKESILRENFHSLTVLTEYTQTPHGIILWVKVHVNNKTLYDVPFRG